MMICKQTATLGAETKGTVREDKIMTPLFLSLSLEHALYKEAKLPASSWYLRGYCFPLNQSDRAKFWIRCCDLTVYELKRPRVDQTHPGVARVYESFIHLQMCLRSVQQQGVCGGQAGYFLLHRHHII